MERINVLHIIPGLGIGGAEKVVLALCKNLNHTAFRPLILHWGGWEALVTDKALRDIVIHEDFRSVVSPRSVLKIYRHIKRQKAAIVQTHLMDADLLGFLAAVLAKVPFIVTIHSYPFPVERRHCMRYRFFSLFPGRFVCVSKTVKDHFARVTGVPKGKIDVVHNGIPLASFSEHLSPSAKKELRRSLSIPGDHAIVGTVGRLIEDKGHRYLLEAFPTILAARPDTTFLMVGDGELKELLKDLCTKLGIEKNVIFIGSRDDVPALLDIMSIFVYPTFREALGIAVIEAMAMGKAIVATNDAAIPELITHDQEGILIPPGKPGELAKNIVDLLNNPTKRVALGQAARVKSLKFSSEAMSRSMESIYLKLIGYSSRRQ